MRSRYFIRALPCFIFTAALLIAPASDAACMNKYIFRAADANKKIVTFLTGKLTFQEAQQLANDITHRKASPMEWVEENGKLISRQFGDMKVVRPMPVGCDGKASGVVVTATFMTLLSPSGTMYVKLDPNTTVAFEQQKD